MTVITCIEDLRVLAQKRVPRMFHDYADSGSWTESTYRANSSDFEKVHIGRPCLYGLGAMGGAGVSFCLDIIRNELDLSMGFCSLRDVRHADKNILLPGTFS